MSPTIPLIFLVVISATDLLRRKIPNSISITVCLSAIVIHAFIGGVAGAKSSVLGLSIGFFFLLLPFLLSGMGAGDVKGFTALGALLGPSAIFQTFLYTALVGGIISVLICVVTCDIGEKVREWGSGLLVFAATRDPSCLAPAVSKKKHKFPYAPAMLFGYVSYLVWGNLV